MLNMESLLTNENKHLLWIDELEDDFILLKYAEIYRYSKNTLMICCWSKKRALQLIKKGLIIAWDRDDDLLYQMETDLKNLGYLIALGAFKKRPDIRGKWISGKSELLGHKIKKYNPNSLKNKPGGKIPEQLKVVI